MKRTRKGFTLIELLIVVAILSSLAAMFGLASSDSVNSANATSIIANLKVMKNAAMAWYIENPEKDVVIIPPDAPTSVADDFAGTLGTTGAALRASGYYIISKPDGCFVFYNLSASELANPPLQTMLSDRAKKAGLYGAASWNDSESPFGFASIYTYTPAEGETPASNTPYIGMKVR